MHKQITFWRTGINTIYEVPPGGRRTTAEYKSKALNCKTKLSYQGSLTPGSTLLRFRNGRGMDQILSELRLSSKTKRRNRLEYKAKHSFYGSYNKTLVPSTNGRNKLYLMSFIRFGKLKSIHSFITKGRCVKSRRRLTVLDCHATT